MAGVGVGVGGVGGGGDDAAPGPECCLYRGLVARAEAGRGGQRGGGRAGDLAGARASRGPGAAGARAEGDGSDHNLSLEYQSQVSHWDCISDTRDHIINAGNVKQSEKSQPFVGRLFGQDNKLHHQITQPSAPVVARSPSPSYLQVGNSSNGSDVRRVILQLGAGQTAPGATSRLRVVIIAEMTES